MLFFFESNGTHMLVKLNLEIVIVASKLSGEIQTYLLSPIGGGHQAAELWRARNSGAYAIYHQDAYYNNELMERRKTGTMRHPRHRNDQMVLIGLVWGAPTWSPDESWVIARVPLVISDVAIDEC
jgi:hypothetical protein